ncbi:amino acid adenylation domain-containing protein [Kitasatospora sp. NPDC004669]|uniref:non-ribosomal peptide synthetase n=1 Tax=Kitasatospora sp. NPDC004669 TaxID=3154555 RepID=UPI0033B7E7C8
MGPAAISGAAPGGRSTRDLTPATRKEEAMWLLERLVPDAAANNLSLAFQVEGTLDPAVLQAALDVMLRRHEVLRTVYFTSGAELMKSVVPAEHFVVRIEEIAEFAPPAEEIELALRPWMTRRFAFDGRPLVRAGLFHHPDGQVVCLAFHHLVYDIISGTTLLKELVAAYDGIAAGAGAPAELLTPVATFHEPEPSPESLAYWRERLEDFDPEVLDLACGASDGADPTLRGDQLAYQLSGQARAAVAALGRAARAPEAVVLLAAYYVLLAAHGAGPDITVGSPVSVRPKEDPGAVGHHTNVLPLRVSVDAAEGFRGLVRRARDAYFGALEHADVPVDSISDLVPRAGSSWRNRLCRHLFNYFPQLGLTDELRLNGNRARALVLENGYSKFDLEFFLASSESGIRIIARYGTDKLDRGDVEALLLRYDALLVAAAADPDLPVGRIQVWSEQDHAVIEAANDTVERYTPTDIPSAVRAHALATPHAVAMEQGDRTVGYHELWEAALDNRDALTSAGVSAGDIVALASARSPELTAAVLGIWLSGAAYLPVDPDHPAQRVAYLLEDSGARVILTDRELPLPADRETARLPLARVGGSPRRWNGEDEPPLIDPASAAYLIYTSGSSGRPKGALLPHRAVANVAADYTVRLRATPEDATLWTTTFAFDMANLEHYVPLYSGGRIVIAPDEARVDGRVLLELLKRYQPGIVQATPTTWRLVLEHVGDQLAGRRVVIGAEPLPVPLAEQLLATGCELHHAYGPTETTTWCTWGILDNDLGERPHIGKPIQNIQVMVVAPDGRELPVGVRGELWITGDGVSLGYHERPELNADRFGDHPRHGRYYRSGDIGRWRADGNLEVFGRSDRQVKLRGNRIELGEVESAVLSHPQVRAAAAVVVGDRSADGRLVVFVESADGPEIVDGLWEHARTELPNSALPQDFLVIDALPTNANEKVDYLALEKLAADGRPAPGASEGSAPEPTDELTRTVVDLFRELLGREDVNAHTNFFTHGGHSLLGAQLIQKLEEGSGVTVKLADLFSAPTPAALAAHVRGA